MATEIAQTCEEEGCTWTGHPCWYPNTDEDPTKEPEPDHYYCSRHAHSAGFCWACGLFWGGVESFDFGAGARIGVCENCLSTGDFDAEDEEIDQEMDEVYSTYPFDCESDWHRPPHDGWEIDQEETNA